MNIQEYLNRLKTELNGLPSPEKSLIVEEIESHLADGQSDPNLSDDEKKRVEQLTIEMGNPEELGRRLKNIHYSPKWLEYLVVVLPEILLFPLLSMIILLLFPSTGNKPTATDLYVYIGIRASIFLQICLVIIGLLFYKRYGQLTSLLFWLSSLWLSIFSMCFREKRLVFLSDFNRSIGGMAESIFWWFVLIGLLFWLSKILWRTKDPLWFTFVCIPFLTTLGNLASSQMLLSGGFPDGYSVPLWRVGWFGLHQMVRFIWPVIFIFPKQRILRWFALLINVTPFALMNLIASSRYPYLIVLWAMPILLVATNWMFEIFGGKRISRINK